MLLACAVTSPRAELGVGADGGVLRGGGQVEIAAGGRRSRHAELGGRGDGGVDGQARGQGLCRGTDGIERAEGIANALLRAGLARNQRQAAVVVQEEQSEFRATDEVRREVLQVDAELALVIGRDRLAAVHRLEIGDVGPAQRAKSTPWSENEPNPSTTFSPPVGAKSVLLKYEPAGSGTWRSSR